MIFLVVGTAPVIAAADRHRGKMMPTPDSAMFTERSTFAGIRVSVLVFVSLYGSIICGIRSPAGLRFVPRWLLLDMGTFANRAGTCRCDGRAIEKRAAGPTGAPALARGLFITTRSLFTICPGTASFERLQSSVPVVLFLRGFPTW